MSENHAGFLAIAMWSVANLLITFTGDTPSFLLGFLVMVPGGLLLLFADLRQGQKLRHIYKQPLPVYVITLGGIGGYIMLHYLAFKMASPFEVNVLDYTWPLFLIIFSVFMHKISLSPFHVAGLLMGFCGTVFLFLHGIKGFNPEEGLGYILSLTGAALFGLYSALTKKHSLPPGFIGLVFILVGSFSLLLHLGFEDRFWPSTLPVWAAISGLAIIRIAYALWDYAMTGEDTAMLASLSYLLPLTSTLLFIVFDRVPLTPWTGLGGILIIAGCLTVNYTKLRSILNWGRA
ncbi:MAG: EamA family transporter [Alphaproteobacteria bacterium]|nr:EamA family transporter [Alphaproteobacteria bacterium]